MLSYKIHTLKKFQFESQRRFYLSLLSVLLILLLFIAIGCNFLPGSGPGVTIGGQQDIAAARTAIEAGDIPDPVSITVEGFMSEHSIPLVVPENPGMLYATASAAWNQDFDAFTPLATVVVGIGTTLQQEDFVRAPLHLSLVIDVSGSMGDLIDVRSETSKLDGVKIAIDRLLSKLDSRDRVSVVSFNTRATTELNPVPGNDIASIKTALEDLQAEGGTNLVVGMQKGFQLLKANQDDARLDRIIVFTDALLEDYQQARTASFINVMEQYALDNFGTTLFGIGTDFGNDVAYDISQVRGGNYYFLGDYDRIVSVFDDEFDYLVTPVAYDVEVDVSVPFEYDVVGVYGIPFEEPLLHHHVHTIPTLFFSSRQGGGVVMIRVRAGALVDFSNPPKLATLQFSYHTPEGDYVSQSSFNVEIPADLDPSAETPYFETVHTKRAVLLLNAALVMKNACEDSFYSSWWYDYDYDYNQGRAIDRITEFLPYFDSLAEGLADRVSSSSRSLSQERALLVQLLTNIRRY